MRELEMRRMQRDTIDTPLRGFLRIIFSIANDYVPDCGELHPDLILKARHQFDPHQRSTSQTLFDAISKFGPGSPRIGLRS